ncbi:sigma-70 family RNA polymerase sigma factor [Sphingomonas abietis]|uniref:Sigma-70 family RNA polymerase sigma factor n=2 Tax=Sphingomonas abietis TaxID=3012344 RepID=A0ABY7NUT3_9SPHN|nr:sigma-70 family RNA polymerase sigma factor [Sphingomonas abietis]
MAAPPLAETFMTARPALLRYLRARGAGEAAQDLVQELWLKLGSVSLSQADDPLAYLYRMAHNLMLDRRRSDVRRSHREANFQQDIGPIDDTPDAEHVLIARERLRHVDRALATLGARSEQIFRRYRLDGVSQRDIAQDLGISLSAVEKHLQKAYRAVANAQAAYGRSDSTLYTDPEPDDDVR